MRFFVPARLLIALVIATGCHADDERQAQSIVSEVDGVLHVQLPADGIVDAPEWQLREVYDTSPSGSDVELFRVMGARLLNYGTLVIANGGSHELLYLDHSGELERRFGREGSGPGEFSMMTALNVDASGDLLVYDAGELRMTRLTASGDLLAIERMSSDEAGMLLYPLAELADGRILTVRDDRFSPLMASGASGESRDTVPLIAFDLTEARWDTLGSWAAQEWANHQFAGGFTRAEMGFGRTLAYSGRGGRAALGSTDSLEVWIFGDTGRLTSMIFGWGAAGDVGADAVERWRSELLEQRSRAPEEIRRWLATSPHRATYPAFRDLLVDNLGRIWIGMYPPPGGAQRWIVVGTDGRLAGQFTLGDGSTLLDAAGGQVVVLRRSEMGEEYVVVMAVEVGEG